MAEAISITIPIYCTWDNVLNCHKHSSIGDMPIVQINHTSRVSSFLMRAETQRAITAYPFDHPENILHLSHSLALFLFLSLFPPFQLSPLSLPGFPRVSPPFLHPIFIQIHWEAPPRRVGTPSPPVTGALHLSRSPLVLFFSLPCFP